ncbi:MAG: Rpn family recombination-promoting nuclease/putative transposase [Bacteroidota bacterium]
MGKQKDDHLHHPHTRFLEVSFSNQKVAVDFIDQFIQEQFSKKLDAKGLRIQKVSYLTNQLKRRFADVLYECPYGEGEDKVWLHFLIEHKSQPEPFPYLQFLEYKLLIWQKQGKKKTPVVPIILYHGEQRWKTRKFEEMFQGVDENTLRFLPSFEYILIDLSNYSDEFILNLRRGFLINTLITLKHFKDKNYIINNIKNVFSLTLEKHEWRLYEIQFVYITQNIELSNAEQIAIVDRVHEPLKEKIMSTYEALIQKGEMKKLVDSVLRLYELGSEIDFIAKAMNISEAEVIAILKKHGKM